MLKKLSVDRITATISRSAPENLWPIRLFFRVLAGSLAWLALTLPLTACVDPELDPAQTCEENPRTTIREDISISYVNTSPIPGEIETIYDTLEFIPYRFTEGLRLIEIRREDPDHLGRTYAYSGHINLYRGANGFDGDSDSFDKLREVLAHEIGHFVDWKIADGRMGNGRVAEYYDLVENNCSTCDAGESFANAFSWYLLKGEFARSFIQVTPWAGAANWFLSDWLRDNLFCGIEYENQLSSAQLNEADVYFIYDPMRTDMSVRERALVEYQELLERFPGSPEIPDARIGVAAASAYIDQANCESSLREITDVAIWYNTWQGAAQRNIAETYLICGNFEAAISAYRELVERDDPYWGPWALWEIAEIYCDNGRYAEAEETYRERIERYPDNNVAEIYIKIADLYARQGYYVAAFAQLENVVREYPDWADEAQYTIAFIYDYYRQDYFAAIEAYLLVGDNSPVALRGRESLLRVADIYKDELGMCEEAIVYYERFLATYPNDRDEEYVLSSIEECS